MLKFAVIGLHRIHGHKLSSSKMFNWLLGFIHEANPDFRFWADLRTACNNSGKLAEISKRCPPEDEDINKKQVCAFYGYELMRFTKYKFHYPTLVTLRN